MNKQQQLLPRLLGEVLSVEELLNISGGRASVDINNEPHDLVTPSETGEPYGSLDVDELDL